MGNCHIYSDHIGPLTEQVKRIPYDFPRLNILHKKEILEIIINNNPNHPLALFETKDITEALQAFHDLTKIEGIMPALESSHALAYAAKLAPKMKENEIVIVNLSGRGDKDIQTVATLEGITL